MAEKSTPNEPPPQYQPPPGGYTQPQGYPPTSQAGGYPPTSQPPGYGYQAGPAVNTVIVQPGYVAGPIPGQTMRYSQSSALIVCQFCQATVTTAMSYDTGLLTWAIAGGICLLGGWLGCCLIPFCIDGTKDVKHTCPNCQNVVGTFRHIR